MVQAYQNLPVERGAPKQRLPSRVVFCVVEMALDFLLSQSLAGGHPKNSMTLDPKLRQTLDDLTAGGCQLTTLFTAGQWATSQQKFGPLHLHVHHVK